MALGLPLIPAYSEASGDQVLHGVNYASAAVGILDITGRNFVRKLHLSGRIHMQIIKELNFYKEFVCIMFDQVGRIPFSQQIRNFQNTLDQITKAIQIPTIVYPYWS